MSEWNQVPFSDLLIESRDGEWGEGQETFGHQLCEVIRGTDFARLNDSNIELPLRWVPDHLVKRKKLAIGDIVFEMAGGTTKQSTGRSAFLRPAFFQHHRGYPVLCASFCRHLRLDRKHYNPAFIYFLLQALYTAGYMAVFNIQHTGVSRFQYTSFKRQTVLDVPSLPTQAKIGAILSAYDDLIENNQRRIALLERMAEESYREWFVRLRFPGHDKVKFVKGVPSGWEQKYLPDIANITYGFAFDASRFNTEGKGKPIIRIRNISESVTTDYTDEVANDKYIVRHGDLVVGMDGEFHINRWQGDEAYLVQRVCKIEARNQILKSYLAHAIRAPIKHFESILMGATVGHLGAMHLKNILLLVPPEHLQERLHVLNDIDRQILQISKASRALSRTRDTLLPRLISGKLSVDNLDIQFPPSMAKELKAKPAAHA